MEKITPRRPELLYMGRGKTPSANLHHHTFYQLEYCLAGKLCYKIGRKRFVLHPQEYCLIPPEVDHEFGGNNENYEYISIKFNSEIKLDTLWGREALPNLYLEKIVEFMAGHNIEVPLYSSEGKRYIETLIGGLLDYFGDFNPNEAEESEFISTIREAVYKFGYNTNVATLAETLGYSRSRFYKAFKAACPRTPTAKHLIDEILLSMIDQHLEYSNMSISKIAQELKFTNIFVFSRFYKRRRGLSPCQARKKMLNN